MGVDALLHDPPREVAAAPRRRQCGHYSPQGPILARPHICAQDGRVGLPRHHHDVPQRHLQPIPNLHNHVRGALHGLWLPVECSHRHLLARWEAGDLQAVRACPAL